MNSFRKVERKKRKIIFDTVYSNCTSDIKLPKQWIQDNIPLIFDIIFQNSKYHITSYLISVVKKNILRVYLALISELILSARIQVVF